MISLRHLYSSFTETYYSKDAFTAYAYADKLRLYVLPAGVTIYVSYYTDGLASSSNGVPLVTSSFVCIKPLVICVDYALTYVDDNDVRQTVIYTYPEFTIRNNKYINSEQFSEFDGKTVSYVIIIYEGNEKYVDNAIYLDEDIECHKLHKYKQCPDDICSLYDLCNHMFNSEFPYLI